jgi:hypothetical protein
MFDLPSRSELPHADICSAYQDSSQGPFVYLDTTVAIDDIVGTTATVDPQWLGINAATADARAADLKGAVFALSLSLNFIGTKWDGYGLLNKTGLKLVVKESQSSRQDGVTFTITDSTSVVIGDSSLELDATYSYMASLEFPNVSVLGVSLGSFSVTPVSSSAALGLTVTYRVTDWQNDALDFYINISADVLGLSIDDHLTLDVTIQDVSQLSGAVESFIKDKVVSFLEDKLNPLNDLEAAVQALTGDFNTVEQDVMAALSEAGHVRELKPGSFFQLPHTNSIIQELEAIANTLKNELNLGMDDIANGLISLGHDFNTVSQVLGSVFNASAQEVVSGLTAAGVAVEHAVSAAFGDVGAALADSFGMVGSSVAGVATDAFDAVKDFVTGDLTNFVDSTISDLGNFAEGAADGAAKFFSGGDCDIM